MYFGTIVRRYVWMWTVMMDGWCKVVKLLECLVTKRGHGKVDFAIVIVQVKVDFDKFFSSGVYETS